MDFRDAIRASFSGADFISSTYLHDLSDQELLARPAPGANHIAWQLGHLISAERNLAELGAPGMMPALPDGFTARHSKETASSDDPEKFLSKAEYLALAKEVRAATLKALDHIDPADMNLPISGKAPPFVKTRGDAFATIAPHWMLHAGQWVLLRRSIGRAVMF